MKNIRIEKQNFNDEWFAVLMDDENSSPAIFTGEFRDVIPEIGDEYGRVVVVFVGRFDPNTELALVSSNDGDWLLEETRVLGEIMTPEQARRYWRDENI